jgi:hypothetical protein
MCLLDPASRTRSDTSVCEGLAARLSFARLNLGEFRQEYASDAADAGGVRGPQREFPV